ncbi:MAG: hypothetical protein K6G88_14590 [Lachnospiraceae bacterium]|nr:hypothetical protein [Lachnospiraceae bacterium]
MIKRFLVLALSVAMSVSMVTGCANNSDKTDKKDKKNNDTTTVAEDITDSADSKDLDEDKSSLEDGVYEAEFKTDSSMFHVNETKNGKGTLTVKDGKMTIHITLVSQKIVNLFVGMADDAKKDGAAVLEPTTDKVKYDDGTEEEVFGFDVPVEALDTEFDLAILGSSGRWFDHKVSVSNPVPVESDNADVSVSEGKSVSELKLNDGTYLVDVALEGGSGRASVTSPCEIKIENGEATATIEWSSSKYDYMMVGEDKYLPVNEEGNSTFVIPFDVFDAPVEVSADTTAMSKPYLIDYTLQFDSASIAAK